MALRRPETMKSAVRSPAFRRNRLAQTNSVTPNDSAYRRDYELIFRRRAGSEVLRDEWRNFRKAGFVLSCAPSNPYRGRGSINRLTQEAALATARVTDSTREALS